MAQGKFSSLMADYKAEKPKEKNIISLGFTETGYEVKLGMSEMGHTLISGMSRSGKSRMAKSMMVSIMKFADVAIFSPKIQDYVEFMDQAYVDSDSDAFGVLIRRVIGEMERRNDVLVKKSIEAGKSVRCTESPMLIVIDEFASFADMAKEDAMRALKRIIREGAGLNVFLMLITQTASKKVLSEGLKDNILTSIAFKAQNSYASRMAIGSRDAEFLELGQGIVQNVDKQFTVTRYANE